MTIPKSFPHYLSLARRFVEAGRLPALLLSVARKREKIGPAIAELREELLLLQILCLAWWRGEYRAISKPAVMAAVAALLYFVTPLDALPDWLPLAGFVDDLALLAWVLRSWREELAAFRVWREVQAPELLRLIEQLPVDEQ